MLLAGYIAYWIISFSVFGLVPSTMPRPPTTPVDIHSALKGGDSRLSRRFPA